MLALQQIGPFLFEDTRSWLAQLLGFALFFAIVIRFMPKTIPLGFPYLKEESGARAERITQSLQQIETALADTQRLHDDYAARLQSIEGEARQRIEAAIREAEAARNDIIADAQQATQQLRRRAEEEIAREYTRQRILLRREIVQRTLDAAEQSVIALNNEKVQRQLIQDFIAQAGNGSVAPVATMPSAPTTNAGENTPLAETIPPFETPGPTSTTEEA